MRFFKNFILVCFLLPLYQGGVLTALSEPVSVRGFRALCDVHIDSELKIYERKTSWFPGVRIFVCPTLLNQFFSYMHPKINTPYVLITHGSDRGVPGPFARYLSDEKIDFLRN